MLGRSHSTFRASSQVWRESCGAKSKFKRPHRPFSPSHHIHFFTRRLSTHHLGFDAPSTDSLVLGEVFDNEFTVAKRAIMSQEDYPQARIMFAVERIFLTLFGRRGDPEVTKVIVEH